MIERAEGSYLIDGDGPPLPRRRLLALVQRARPPARRDRRRGPRPARQGRPLDHARPLPPRRRRAGRRLVELAPAGLSRVFYSESGSTAVEIALKMAFQYQQQRGGQHAPPHLLRPPARLLPRRHDRLGLGRRHRPLPLHLPAAALPDPRRRARRRRRPRARARLPRRGDRRGDRRAAGPGRRRDAHPPARLPARGARALRPLRRAADLRRGGDRLRPHRHDVRLRARGRRARPALPRQGPDRRLPAAGGDPGDRADLRGLPRRPRGVPHLLPRPHLHRQPARLRRRARQPRRLRAGADDRAAAAEDRAAAASCWPRSRRCPR